MIFMAYDSAKGIIRIIPSGKKSHDTDNTVTTRCMNHTQTPNLAMTMQERSTVARLLKCPKPLPLDMFTPFHDRDSGHA